jgi:hypothetical protein
MGEGRKKIICTWVYKSFQGEKMGKVVPTMAMAIAPTIK